MKSDLRRARPAVLLAHLAAGCPCERRPAQPETPRARPAKWAQPLDVPGCPSLYRVSDGLYRGAQPSAEGMAQLKKMGIKTIVSLRYFHSDRDEIGDLDLRYEHIGMKAWRPKDEQVIHFLRAVTDKDNAPVFVHCRRGSERTGMMCAIYRIAVQGWSREEALKEMAEGGYGFHGIWRNLLRFVDGLEIDEMKARAGM